MTREKDGINRRDFLRRAGTAGLASAFAAGTSLAGDGDPNAAAAGNIEKLELPQVPKRVLGKTGVKVPILNLGGVFDIPNNQIILQKAIEWGVTYWDTANSYVGGNSELGIGIYLKKHPKIRKKLFIVSKSRHAKNIKGMEEHLQISLKRMNTKYIDLYYLHAVDNPKQLTDDVKNWAQQKKEQGLIRFFGFSAHDNMAPCLMAASELDWIDAIMMRYSFRHLDDKQMQEAVEACHKAKIGLIAMKTQGAGPIKPDSEQDQKLAGHFLKQGYSEHQARIKAIWQDERIASICSQMPSIAILGANVAAAIDKTKLSDADIKVLKHYARATCDGYCAGCQEICSAAVPGVPCVGDVMRYMMYHDTYGNQQHARELYAEIPADIRARLGAADYTLAEAHCPQHIAIAKIMADAAVKLA